MMPAKNVSTPLGVHAAKRPFRPVPRGKKFNFEQYMDACQTLCKYEFIDRDILETMVTEFHTRKIGERAFRDKYSNYPDLAEAIVIVVVR